MRADTDDGAIVGDKYDEQVKALLPCVCQSVRGPSHNAENTYCPAYRREAVAAALRDLGTENDQLRQRIVVLENPRITQGDFAKLAELQREQLADLQAENERLTKERDHLNSELANISFVTPAFRDNALSNENASLKAENDRLKADLNNLQHHVAKTAHACKVPHDNDFHASETLDRIINFYTDLQAENERLKAKCAEKDDEYAQQVAFAEAKIAELRADQLNWRKGVEFIASALGDQHPSDLSWMTIARIAEVALTMRAELETLRQRGTRLDGLREAFDFPDLTGGNARAIAWHLKEGQDNAGLSKQALADFINSIASQLERIETRIAAEEAKEKP